MGHAFHLEVIQGEPYRCQKTQAGAQKAYHWRKACQTPSSTPAPGDYKRFDIRPVLRSYFHYPHSQCKAFERILRQLPSSAWFPAHNSGPPLGTPQIEAVYTRTLSCTVSSLGIQRRHILAYKHIWNIEKNVSKCNSWGIYQFFKCTCIIYIVHSWLCMLNVAEIIPVALC